MSSPPRTPRLLAIPACLQRFPSSTQSVARWGVTRSRISWHDGAHEASAGILERSGGVRIVTLCLLPVGSRGNSALVYRGNTIRPGERRYPIRRWNVCAAARQDGDRIRQDRRHGLGCRVASPQQFRKPEWHAIVQACPDRCSWPHDAEPPRRSRAIPPRKRLRGIPRCSAYPARRTAPRERQKPIVLCRGKPESRGLFRPFDQFAGVGVYTRFKSRRSSKKPAARARSCGARSAAVDGRCWSADCFGRIGAI